MNREEDQAKDSHGCYPAFKESQKKRPIRDAGATQAETQHHIQEYRVVPALDYGAILLAHVPALRDARYLQENRERD